MQAKKLRSFDVWVGTGAQRSLHHVLAYSSMAAFQVALHTIVGTGPLRSLVVRPR